MGWEVLVLGRFGERGRPAERAPWLVGALPGATGSAAPHRLRILEGARFGRKRLDRYAGADREQAITTDELLAACRAAGEADAVESWWEVPRWLPGDSDADPPQAEPGRLIVFACGPACSWPGLQAPVPELVIEADNDKDLRPRLRGEAARRNGEALVGELARLVDAGLDAVEALDGERRGGGSAWLRADAGWTAEAGNDRLLDAILATPFLGFVETRVGPLVYHRDLADGNLGELYEELRRRHP